ncbi:MAG: PIN domain-containing protein [Pseudonocardiaceae bacterium]
MGRRPRRDAPVEDRRSRIELIDSSAWIEYLPPNYRTVRRGGQTVRKLLDCLIASVAMRADATLVHRDHGFDVMAGRMPDLLTTVAWCDVRCSLCWVGAARVVCEGVGEYRFAGIECG